MLFSGLWDLLRVEFSLDDAQSAEKAKSFFIRDAEFQEALIFAKKIKSLWIRKTILRIAIWERKIAFKFQHEDVNTNLGRAIAEQTDICEA